MNPTSLTLPVAEQFKRSMLLVIIAMSVLGTLAAWYILSTRGLVSPVLQLVFVSGVIVLPLLFLVAWLRLLPQRVVEIACLLYAAIMCVGCMVLKMYSPVYGADIDLQPLYLWIPVLYVFAFTLTDHRTGLVISVGFMLLFVIVSMPFLVRDAGASAANFTLQLHVVSVAFISALYFFSSYQQRLSQAQVKVSQLARLSNTDDLTRLSNRRHMAAAFDAALADLARGGGRFAVMLFDVDHFKAINDRLGHAAGDAALVALAEYASEVFRGVGVMGRWGGDEFVALVWNIGHEDAVRMAQALGTHVASESLPGGESITISCGVTAAVQGDDVDSLLRRADAALYAAKRGGRNRVECVLDDA